VGSIIYNYQAGAGGEGFVARHHGLAYAIDKLDKVRFKDDHHNILKDSAASAEFFYNIMELEDSIYLTHHLYLLDDDQLRAITSKHHIRSVDSSAAYNEIFILRLFKDLLRLRDEKDIWIILSGKLYSYENLGKNCILDHLIPGDDIGVKIDFCIADYANREGIFYQDNLNWHDNLARIPGEKIIYSKKPRLGQLYLHGRYWDLDSLLNRMVR